MSFLPNFVRPAPGSDTPSRYRKIHEVGLEAHQMGLRSTDDHPAERGELENMSEYSARILAYTALADPI
jgi:hypothetical protein